MSFRNSLLLWKPCSEGKCWVNDLEVPLILLTLTQRVLSLPPSLSLSLSHLCLPLCLCLSVCVSILDCLASDLHPHSLNITPRQLLLSGVFPQTPVLLIYYFPLDFLLAAHVLHIIKIFNPVLNSSFSLQNLSWAQWFLLTWPPSSWSPRLKTNSCPPCLFCSLTRKFLCSSPILLPPLLTLAKVMLLTSALSPHSSFITDLIKILPWNVPPFLQDKGFCCLRSF